MCPRKEVQTQTAVTRNLHVNPNDVRKLLRLLCFLLVSVLQLWPCSWPVSKNVRAKKVRDLTLKMRVVVKYVMTTLALERRMALRFRMCVILAAPVTQHVVVTVIVAHRMLQGDAVLATELAILIVLTPCAHMMLVVRV